MRVIVCGGRDYSDVETMFHVLANLPDEPITVVHGGARGADRLAADVAMGLCYRVEPHLANWRAHGKAAGPIRNQAMLDSGADLVIAFPGGKGTADMVRRARDAGVEVQTLDDLFGSTDRDALPGLGDDAA